VIGSYYTCLKKPDEFFHLFPEWTFVFRDPSEREIMEVRVSDGRMPPLPYIDVPELNELRAGQIAMYMKFKVSLAYLGADSSKRDASDIVTVLDREGRSYIELVFGKSQEDSFTEVVESDNSKVFVRARLIGRPTDHAGSYTVVQNPVRLGSTTVATARFPARDFYASIDPISDWNIDVNEAVHRAVARGAQAIPPGKFGMSGGPGLFRLHRSARGELDGSYWQLPYRIGIRPILVDAKNGDVYAVNDSGNYSRKW